MKSATQELMESAAREYLSGLSPDKRNQFLVECAGEQRTPSKLLTMKEAAARFGCTVRTIQRWARYGEIQTIKRGRLVRIPEESLYAMTSGGAK